MERRASPPVLSAHDMSKTADENARRSTLIVVAVILVFSVSLW
jgi:hypothetical protein